MVTNLIHARSDYARFQEPRELLEEIHYLVACIQTGQAPTSEELDKRVGALNAKYNPSGMGTPFAADEPVFLLRAKDTLFVPALEFYMDLVGDHSNTEQKERMHEAISLHIALAESWQSKNPPKAPDMPMEVK